MHEFSIAENIVKGVLVEMRKVPRSGRVRKVRIAVGGLHQVVSDTLVFAYEVLVKGTPAEGSRLELRRVPVAVQCRQCGWEGGVEVPLFRCGGCGSGDVEVTKGRELLLESMEIEREENDNSPH